jgi:hypothetical protein
MAMDEGQITRSFSLRMYGKAAYTQAASVHGAQKPTHNRMHVFASRWLRAVRSRITDARDKSESATEHLVLF